MVVKTGKFTHANSPFKMTQGDQTVYIIPPYLLNTSLGERLQRIVSGANKELGESNVVSVNSNYYRPHDNEGILGEYQYSTDSILNEIIKFKLIFKLQIIGVLGDELLPPASYSDQEIYELFETFKSRLLAEEKRRSNDEEDDDQSTPPKEKVTALESDKIGEILLFRALADIPQKYTEYLLYSLKDLLLVSKLDIQSKSGTSDSFFKIDDERVPYILPAAWVSLIPNAILRTFNTKFNLSCQFDKGYSTIDISTIASPKPNKESIASRYLNFITDKPITPSCGIYYYEVEIAQECTEATELNPILSYLDESLAAEKPPNICLGFTRKTISYDTRGSGSTSNEKVIDLEEVKQLLVFNQDSLINRPLNASYETFLDAKPGELRGSFALDLSDRYFNNSIKGSEALHRSAILTMGRRLSSLNRHNLEELDSGRIDTDVSLSTAPISDSEEKKVYQTDVVGFGINYVDQSLFMTLNGVLMKSVSKEELMSSNPLNDNLFTTSSNYVYPIIGFKVNDVSLHEGYEPSKLRIKTNLGFRDFKFNINNYFQQYKSETSRNLYRGILNLSQSVKSNGLDEVEKEILNVNDDSKLLNELIKGYLYIEGYIDTFNALSDDLNEFSNTPERDSKVIEVSHGKNRNLLRLYFKNNQFTEAIKLIKDQYSSFFADSDGQDIIFTIRYHQLVYLLKQRVEKVLSEGVHGDILSNDANVDILSMADELRAFYAADSVKIQLINKAAALILVKDQRGYEKMPFMKNFIKKYPSKMRDLFDLVNKKILKELDCNTVSNLEYAIRKVDRNFQELSLVHGDNQFGLINFENDQLNI